MDLLLTGDDPTLKILREQYRLADVIKRELTGVGFFITFAVPSKATRLEGSESIHIGDVEAQTKELQHGAGFVLHIRNGVIECLEGYSYDEPWPVCFEDFHLSYVTVHGASWKRQSADGTDQNG